MFDRFDVCDAYYLFAADWHKGQWSPEYAIFGRLSNLGYQPGLSVRNGNRRGLTVNARGLLAGLIRRARQGETIGH